jgi:hypothetical protein
MQTVIFESFCGCCALPFLFFWIVVIYWGAGWADSEKPINKFFVGLVLFLIVVYAAVYIKFIYFS